MHSHRFVLVLYKIRKPHCRHRTGSPPLIIFRAPQSPHLYSTPLMRGTPVPELPGSAPPGVVADCILYNNVIDVVGVVMRGTIVGSCW